MDKMVIEASFKCAHCDWQVNGARLEIGALGSVYTFKCPLCKKWLGVLYDELFSRSFHFMTAKGRFVADGQVNVFQYKEAEEDSTPTEEQLLIEEGLFQEEGAPFQPARYPPTDRRPTSCCLESLHLSGFMPATETIKGFALTTN